MAAVIFIKLSSLWIPTLYRGHVGMEQWSSRLVPTLEQSIKLRGISCPLVILCVGPRESIYQWNNCRVRYCEKKISRLYEPIISEDKQVGLKYLQL